MIIQFHNPVRSLPRPSRILLAAPIALLVFVGLYSLRTMKELPPTVLEQHVLKQKDGTYRIPKGPLPSVNLVVATLASEDYSWTKELKVPNLQVVPYIADNASALYHPKKNKGHEAMIYLQYFYDFYDNLTDVSILVHSQNLQWHIEELLDQSMVFSLNHLDLREVQRRQFVNLRVTWGLGCSNGAMNTTRVNEESGNAPEQKEMQEAFRANFNIYDIPEILATPCCSQIAVTKAMVRSVPRKQYLHHINWLLKTELEDALSGRVWEHMWQYLFLQKDIDCPLEHKAYCRLYHICFGGWQEYDEWIELMQGRGKLEEELKRVMAIEQTAKRKKEMNNGQGMADADQAENDGRENEEERDIDEWRDEEVDQEEEMKRATKLEREIAKTKRWLREELISVDEAIRVRKEVAVVRGSVEANRILEGENLYGDELEPGLEDPQTAT